MGVGEAPTEEEALEQILQPRDSLLNGPVRTSMADVARWGHSGVTGAHEAGVGFGMGVLVVVAVDEGEEVGRGQSQRVLYSM